jgi:membrane protease YdiL (CAAX protease family)
MDPPVTLADSAGSLTALLAVLGALLAIVRLWERLPWSSLGLRRPTAQSAAWGSALAAFFVFALGPWMAGLLAWFDSAGFDPGVAATASLPPWYLISLVVVVGTMEEVLYRGYAMGRIADWTGSRLAGATISTVAFALAHVPMWGWLTSLSFVLSGGILAGFYAWRRDLNANILAHVLTDLVGIALAHST